MTHHVRIDADGTAALAISESLLLALTDLKIITDREARDLLEDVAAAHQEASDTSLTPERHEAVVAIIQRILDGKKGVRHTAPS